MPIAWYSTGLVPVAVQDQAGHDFITQLGAIPVIPFSAIRWDPATEALFESAEIDELFGPVAAPAQRRKFVFNDVHFAELLLRKLCLAIDPNTQNFSKYRIERDSWEKVSRQDLCKLITNGLIGMAGKCPDYFPPSEVKQQRVEHILWLMEMSSAELPGQCDTLELFFAEAVEVCAGAKLTSAEFFSGFRTYCQARDLRLCTEAFFHRQATKKCGRASHCFGENGTQRGRLGWRLRQEVICNVSAGPDQHGTLPSA